MIRIEDGRGTGKTSRLLLIAKENGQTIVVPTFRHKQFVEDLATRYFGKDHGIKIITAYRFFDPKYIQGKKERFLIDDLDYILMNYKIVGYSMSKENCV